MICKKCGAIISDDDFFSHKCNDSESTFNSAFSKTLTDNNSDDIDSVSTKLSGTIFDDNNNNSIFEKSNEEVIDKEKSVNIGNSNDNLNNPLFKTDSNNNVSEDLSNIDDVFIGNSSDFDGHIFDNNSFILEKSNEEVTDEEKSVNIGNFNDNLNNPLFKTDSNSISVESSEKDDVVNSVDSKNDVISSAVSLNKNGHSLFITIFVLFVFTCFLGSIFLLKDRLFGTLSGDNLKRSNDCRMSIKNAYKEYVNLYGAVSLKDGTCIIITNNVKKINFNIGDDNEKIIEFRDGNFYQDSIALDNYELAISYSKDDMDAIKKGNDVMINSFYFDSNEILK